MALVHEEQGPLEWTPVKVEAFRRELDQVEAALAEVERALSRLDDGSYGTCEVCGRSTEWQAEEGPTAGLRCTEHR